MLGSCKKGIKAVLFAKQKKDSNPRENEGHGDSRNDINHAFLKDVYAKNAYVCAKMRLKTMKMQRKKRK